MDVLQYSPKDLDSAVSAGGAGGVGVTGSTHCAQAVRQPGVLFPPPRVSQNPWGRVCTVPGERPPASSLGEDEAGAMSKGVEA